MALNEHDYYVVTSRLICIKSTPRTSMHIIHFNSDFDWENNCSRSHTILTVYISSEQPAENGVFLSRSGKIHFVDLAGSEMTKKTQSQGKTLEEANNINKSLMVLGKIK